MRDSLLTKLVTVGYDFLQGNLILDEEPDFDVHRVEILFQLLVPPYRMHNVALQQLHLHLFVVVALQIAISKLTTARETLFKQQLAFPISRRCRKRRKVVSDMLPCLIAL